MQHAPSEPFEPAHKLRILRHRDRAKSAESLVDPATEPDPRREPIAGQRLER